MWVREKGLTVEGNPGEARAGTQTTRHLIDPSVIKLHPGGLAGTKMARLDIFPKALIFEVFASLDRVDRPFAPGSEAEQLHGTDQNGASRRAQVVFALAEPKNNGTEAKHDRGQKPCAPESNVLLNIDHAELTCQGANVDEHVKVQEDARDGDVGIGNDALARLRVFDDTRL